MQSKKSHQQKAEDFAKQNQFESAYNEMKKADAANEKVLAAIDATYAREQAQHCIAEGRLKARDFADAIWDDDYEGANTYMNDAISYYAAAISDYSNLPQGEKTQVDISWIAHCYALSGHLCVEGGKTSNARFYYQQAVKTLEEKTSLTSSDKEQLKEYTKWRDILVAREYKNAQPGLWARLKNSLTTPSQEKVAPVVEKKVAGCKP